MHNEAMGEMVDCDEIAQVILVAVTAVMLEIDQVVLM